jgi:5-methylcytosine-specific restriction endonuclease McrA
MHVAKKRSGGRPMKIEMVLERRVFEAAEWRCAICCTYTPPSHRGTFQPDAPEIDHIVPLLAGGDHAYSNVQCLCRLCNVAKGDHPFPHIKFWRRRGLPPPI